MVRGATTYQPQHPFQLTDTFARLNAERSTYFTGQAGREGRVGDADSEDEAEIARYASGSGPGSSESSRTLQDDIVQATQAGSNRRQRAALFGYEDESD